MRCNRKSTYARVNSQHEKNNASSAVHKKIHAHAYYEEMKNNYALLNKTLVETKHRHIEHSRVGIRFAKLQLYGTFANLERELENVSNRTAEALQIAKETNRW